MNIPEMEGSTYSFSTQGQHHLLCRIVGLNSHRNKYILSSFPRWRLIATTSSLQHQSLQLPICLPGRQPRALLTLPLHKLLISSLLKITGKLLNCGVIMFKTL